MPVRKFRNIEEMNAADEERRASTSGPELLRRIDSLWREGSFLLPPLAIPKGVHKFRSIEEMNAFKDRYVNERIALLRARRSK
jgi:hypothetical protein